MNMTTNTAPYIKLAVCPSFPIIPTAPFTHKSRNAPASPTPTAPRYIVFSDLLTTNSYARPIPNKSPPITMKSVRSQTTSLVNCIAIKGNSNIVPVKRAILTVALYINLSDLKILLFQFTHQKRPDKIIKVAIHDS